MADNIGSRIRHAWNAFTNKEQQDQTQGTYSYGSGAWGTRPDRTRLSYSNERSIISATIMRMAIDAASVDMYHARVDENGYFVEQIDSGLNNCLTVEANIDQDGRALLQDIVQTMLDKGAVAIVPIDTSLNPNSTGGYDIKTMRVGEVITWYPQHVTVRVYNDQTGLKEDVTMPKKMVTIVENPLYAVMNEPNSTLQRLIRKLNLLDAIDEQSASGSLDILIQLPYSLRSETKQQQAEQRKGMLEDQLRNSKYGIGYIDATEKVTQLNRPAENNMLKQIEFLMAMLYGQLGITKEVMEGTADEKAMLNYYVRTIKPILKAISGGMKRTFLTKTARSQNQSIVFLRNPFESVAIGDLAELSDKLTRNEIVTSNEMRPVFGLKPSKDPKADELRNKNIPAPEDTVETPALEASPEPIQIEPTQQRLAIEGPKGSRVKKIMEGQ